jgi:hypothetical protein
MARQSADPVRNDAVKRYLPYLTDAPPTKDTLSRARYEPIRHFESKRTRISLDTGPGLG